MKKIKILTALFLVLFVLGGTGAFSLFAQESERDYVDDQNMSVSEVEELIQSQSFINKIDFVFGIAPVTSINSHTKNSDGKFISAPTPLYFPVRTFRSSLRSDFICRTILSTKTWFFLQK